MRGRTTARKQHIVPGRLGGCAMASRRLAALRSVVLAVAGLLMLIVPAAASVEASNATESESSVNGL